MKPESTNQQNYSEHVVQAGKWQLQVITYQLRTRHVCMINIVEPKARVCRVTALTRNDALRSALDLANHRLARTVVLELQAASTPAPTVTLDRMEYREGTKCVRYDVPAFLALPIVDQLTMILSGNLVFLDANNKVLEAGSAMKALGSAGRLCGLVSTRGLDRSRSSSPAAQ